MKKQLQLIGGLLAFGLLSYSCSEEEDSFPEAASLKVVHAASGAPPVHVDYFGAEMEDVDFSINPTLSFARSSRFTIPANETRDLRFTYASDTTTEVFIDEVSLGSGEIATYFLLGDSASLTSAIIQDVGHRTLADSANAVRFINMAEGVESLNIGIQDTNTDLATGLGFSQNSDFIEVDATLTNLEYTFEFKDDEGNVLSAFRFRQYSVFSFGGSIFVSVRALRDNITFALVGQADDGEGNNTLRVVQINNFL